MLYSDYGSVMLTKTELDANRNKILALQDSMESMESSLDKFPVTHYFAPHTYAREMFLPAGHIIVGKIHKHAHINIISQGHVIVATDEGVKELIAPCTFTSEPNTKRAVQVIKDTIWTTIHITDETDIDKIEDEIIVKEDFAISKDTQGGLL